MASDPAFKIELGCSALISSAASGFGLYFHCFHSLRRAADTSAITDSFAKSFQLVLLLFD